MKKQCWFFRIFFYIFITVDFGSGTYAQHENRIGRITDYLRVLQHITDFSSEFWKYDACVVYRFCDSPADHPGKEQTLV